MTEQVPLAEQGRIKWVWVWGGEVEGSVQAKETQVGWRHVSWGLGIFTVEVVSEKKKSQTFL